MLPINNLHAIGQWKSIDDFFRYLNAHIKYVVLRNYECLPEKYTMKEHEDIDLLVESLAEFKKYVGGKSKKSFKFIGYSTIVNINGENVKLDVRYVGDGYYDTFWEQDILEKRVFEKKLFYRTDDENYRYSLAYHAIFHKYKFSDEYSSRLGTMFGNDSKLPEKQVMSLLNDFMKQNDYRVTEPRDIYVEFGGNYVAKERLIRRKILKFMRKILMRIRRLIWVK